MIFYLILLGLAWIQLHSTNGSQVQVQDNITTTNRSITVKDNSFVLDGKKFRYVSGELHYFRAPHQYWRALLKKLRAAGLNAVSTYVEWSFHEPEERQYDWRGDRDLERFLELAAEEHLLVLLRPGPYICAERDMGGLPYWLLSKYPDIPLRSADKRFMKEVRIWFKVLFDKIQPHLYGNGGPIILVQVENEYGYYSCNKKYMRLLSDIMKQYVKDAALLYTADSPEENFVKCGSLYTSIATVNFKSDRDASAVFENLRNTMGPNPLVNSEYYTGWITHWGSTFNGEATRSVVHGLREQLRLGASVNFYMFFGGTNFEFTSGANLDINYKPTTTSYDYDAPLTEYGGITPKYLEIKDMLGTIHPWANYLNVSWENATEHYWLIKVKPKLNILSTNGRLLLGKDKKVVKGKTLPTFERRRQRAGLLLYETQLPPCNNDSRVLYIMQPRDRVYVYMNKIKVGVISWSAEQYKLSLNCTKTPVLLSLLVENEGRVNFGKYIKDFKGILGYIYLDNAVLKGPWNVLGYPLQHLNISYDISGAVGDVSQGPVLYSGTFKLNGTLPKYTFLNTKDWGKGYAWINGHNLGRYWPLAGPQMTLYVPGVYLRRYPRRNLIQMLEFVNSPNNTSSPYVEFINYPVFINK